MILAKLKDEISSAVGSHDSLFEVVDILRDYRSQGVTQHQMYRIIEDLENTIKDGSANDRLNEVADFVAGFCSPHMRIYETQLQEH